jgi:hypothetical protein
LDKKRGRCCSGSREFGEVASKARVDDYLLFVFWFCKFYEKDLRGEVVDVGDAEGDEGVGELVGNDLGLLATWH